MVVEEQVLFLLSLEATIIPTLGHIRRRQVSQSQTLCSVVTLS